MWVLFCVLKMNRLALFTRTVLILISSIYVHSSLIQSFLIPTAPKKIIRYPEFKIRIICITGVQEIHFFINKWHLPNMCNQILKEICKCDLKFTKKRDIFWAYNFIYIIHITEYIFSEAENNCLSDENL